ncbi:hypothetical protein LC609_34515 [Nostoc sp. XA013]|nr:hypothetical protein [Nostoc sp. XA013]
MISVHRPDGNVLKERLHLYLQRLLKTMGKARTRNQMQAPSMKALNATVNPVGRSLTLDAFSQKYSTELFTSIKLVEFDLRRNQKDDLFIEYSHRLGSCEVNVAF